MKNVIFGSSIILLGIITTLTVLTITGTMNREIEMEDALKQSVEKSVDACTSRRGYSLDNNEQFVADLLQELSNAVENDSTLNVEIMGVDKDKGYLSVRVTEYYTSAAGIPKTAKCESTAYLDRGAISDSYGEVTITFVDSDDLYLGEQKTKIGSNIVPVITPNRTNHSFVGWLDTDTNVNVGGDLGQAVNNKTYKAVYS